MLHTMRYHYYILLSTLPWEEWGNELCQQILVLGRLNEHACKWNKCVSRHAAPYYAYTLPQLAKTLKHIFKLK